MKKDKALLTIIDRIKNKFTHQDWKHTVDYAILMKQFITGKNIETLIKRFDPSETEKGVTIRKAITIPVIKPISKKILTPLKKISRVEPAIRSIVYQNDKDQSKAKKLEIALSKMYGNHDLDAYLGERLLDLQGLDPNAWMIELFTDFDHRYTAPQPYITEITAEQAIDFSFVNNMVDYLLVRSTHYYSVKEGEVETMTPGFRYQIYCDNDTVQFTQLDIKLYTSAAKNQVTPQTFIEDGKEVAGEIYRFDDERVFRIEYFEQKSGQTPVFRVGAILDPETNFRTCISILDNATPYFLKSIKTVSEMDLTMSAHAFPQKYVYVPKCEGFGGSPCFGGKDTNSKTCQACDGTGKTKTHTTGLDVIELTLPQEKHLDKAFDLKNLAYYLTLPIDVMKFQYEYTEALEPKALGSVYNSERFTLSQVQKTATGDLLDMDSVYDTLVPYGSKYSEAWVTFVRITASYLDILKDLTATHKFSKDFKYKSVQMLMSEAKSAKDADAPPHIKKEIFKDITISMYNGKPLELKRLEIQQKYDPFEGKTNDEIQFLIGGNYVSKFTRTLFAESKRIWSQLEYEAAAKEENFYNLSEKEQLVRLGDVVKSFVKQIDDDNTITAIPFDPKALPPAPPTA